MKRSEAEQDLVYDLKQKDQSNLKYEERLKQEIQDGLDSLHFLEMTGYATLQEVRVASRKVWADFHNTKEEMEHIDTLIKKLGIIQTLLECEKQKRESYHTQRIPFTCRQSMSRIASCLKSTKVNPEI